MAAADLIFDRSAVQSALGRGHRHGPLHRGDALGCARRIAINLFDRQAIMRQWGNSEPSTLLAATKDALDNGGQGP